MKQEVNTDKESTGLLQVYQRLFEPLRAHPITIMEIGVLDGGFLQWCDEFFTNDQARIIGLDLQLPVLTVSNRVQLSECDQLDGTKLRALSERFQPFDVVIDDASHRSRETRRCFEVLFPHMSTGGYYVIEDWAVGYLFSEFVEYSGMLGVIADIIQDAIQLKIAGLEILLRRGMSVAILEKGCQGWSQ